MSVDIIIDVLLAILAIAAGFLIANYNTIIKEWNRVEESESNIQIYLKERFDLVPNLVEVIKGYTKHENETFVEVAKARRNYEKHEFFDVADVNTADGSINQLIAVAENYPELKADSQYLNLSQQIANLEDEIEHARRKYNRVVTIYNTKVQTVPMNIVAKIFNFKKKELFKLDSEKEQEASVVKI